MIVLAIYVSHGKYVGILVSRKWRRGGWGWEAEKFHSLGSEVSNGWQFQVSSSTTGLQVCISLIYTFPKRFRNNEATKQSYNAIFYSKSRKRRCLKKRLARADLLKKKKKKDTSPPPKSLRSAAAWTQKEQNSVFEIRHFSAWCRHAVFYEPPPHLWQMYF